MEFELEETMSIGQLIGKDIHNVQTENDSNGAGHSDAMQQSMILNSLQLVIPEPESLFDFTHKSQHVCLMYDPSRYTKEGCQDMNHLESWRFT